jgi:C-terminal processing protease CtpA/Prc
MRVTRLLFTFLCSALIALAPSGSFASEPGFLGISIHIEGEGFVANRMVKSVTVNRVVANSPAARAGLQFDDELIEVDGKRLRGSRISELRPLLDRQAGSSITLLVKKKSGQTQSYRVVLDPRPPQ